jgi:two-component system, NtrC family, nitrogen regulation sensor histidine kinase NtrY
MGSNRFYITLVIHVALIFLGAFACFFFFTVRGQPNTATAMAVLSFVIMLRLIHFMNRTNRLLGNFLIYMHEKDPTLSFSYPVAEKHFRGLQKAMEVLIREFKENRIALEMQTRYLEAIVENVSSGIICSDDQGKITIMNRTACHLLDVEKMTSVDELEHHAGKLVSVMSAMAPGDQARLGLTHGSRKVLLLLQSSRIKLKDRFVHILAMNDISHQLEEQEILSWKRLIRVMNHEIMNSITPIITLSRAIVRKLGKGAGKESEGRVPAEILSDAVRSASIIEERSNGLISFIDRYKQLTNLPPVKPELIDVTGLMRGIEEFFREELEKLSVRLILPQNCTLELEADRLLLEQVMINLVKNALEALKEKEDPEIELSCSLHPELGPCLMVRDNGKGIPPDKLDQVFVPFYTTREEGSGIGLNLCRQIMSLHRGQIQLESTPNTGTLVTLTFGPGLFSIVQDNPGTGRI